MAKSKQHLAGIVLFIVVIICSFVITGCEDYKVAGPLVYETDSVTDIDGNVYTTVKIGNQWWMAENLRVTRYRNGDSLLFIGNLIKYEFDTLKWKNLIDTGAYCLGIADLDSSNNSDFIQRRGLLYNWYAISGTGNIAPDGWHVPGDDDWKELEMHLGMSEEEANNVNWRGSDEGNKLKLQKGDNWYEPTDKFEVWGSNESGFSAVGGNCRMYDGSLGAGVNYIGFWWTSTLNNEQAWYRHLDYNKSTVFRYYGPLTYGFSVRCVKD